MFDLNPLHLPDAALQHAIMLAVAALLGFIIGYVSRQRTLAELDRQLHNVEADLATCQQTQTAGPAPDRNSETATLNRIRSRTNRLPFDRIGYATADEADDLKKIAGVGPFLEQKLHSVGIYTFRQVAALTPNDIDHLNELIEFFPGRIERENWVGQAAGLAANTTGNV